MKLQEMFDKLGCKWKIEDITKIYSGLDHCCRCGCGGEYYERGTVGFKRILSKLIAGKVEPYPKGEQRYVKGGGHNEWLEEEGMVYELNFFNIPVAGTSNRCYCLYND